MYRTTLVLLLLAVKLPMMAEEGTGVTVHQAEWGDTRGEALPPSGPAVPIKATSPTPVFLSKGFSYGDNIQYGSGNLRPSGIQYTPGTSRTVSFYRTTRGYEPNIDYGQSLPSVRGSYQPSVEYVPTGSYRSTIRYGFSQ